MNYYERIQKSLEYIEDNMEGSIELEIIAQKAYMSLAVFYRIFFALIGYSPKEYIRLRRIHHAARWLHDSNRKIIDIAMDCGYQSSDAFSKSFRNITGFLPEEFRKQNKNFVFERINLMEKYFDLTDSSLMEKYPDIKILKQLEPFRVISYKAYGKTPENDAFEFIKQWAEQLELLNVESQYRIFGFDIPNSLKEDGSHGYEVWITVPSDFESRESRIEVKDFEGGLYAVTTTTVGSIEATWNRFREWLKLSKYDLGKHQYLEEHLSFEKWKKYFSQNDVKVDLYMPLTEIGKKQIEIINPVHVAYFRATGLDREEVAIEAWNTLLTWASNHQLSPENHKIYVYNQGFRKVKKYWQEIMITIESDFKFEDKKVKIKLFEGGTYMSMKTTLPSLPDAWNEMGRWMALTNSKVAKRQWIEEWGLDNWNFPVREIKVLYPTDI